MKTFKSHGSTKLRYNWKSQSLGTLNLGGVIMVSALIRYFKCMTWLITLTLA